MKLVALALDLRVTAMTCWLSPRLPSNIKMKLQAKRRDERGMKQERATMSKARGAEEMRRQKKTDKVCQSTTDIGVTDYSIYPPSDKDDYIMNIR